MTEKDYWICFSTFVPIGPQRFKLLVDFFGSAKSAWNAPLSKYREIGFSEKLSSSFGKHKKTFNFEDYKNKMEKHKVSVVTLEDQEYPERLKTITDAPSLLYVRGKSVQGQALNSLSELADVSIAVVGTRKMTSYGKDVTQQLVSGLVNSGMTIVSGLALGIDSIAHISSIENNGKTIAVLGNGLDTIYPSSNLGLAHTILDHGGLIISEFPLGFPAMPHNFPIRNRIVSGMSLAVLVIEGTEKSGTLLTASNAAAQGRDVFAVPGQITSYASAAPHYLLKNGAKLVSRVEDILEELDVKTKNKNHKAKSVLPGSPGEEKIVNALAQEELDFDNLARIVGLPTHEILSLLTLMELKGMVKNVGGVYRKV